jgi:hypothetical protein
MAIGLGWMAATVAVLALVHFIIKTVLPFARMARAVNKFPGPAFKFPTGTMWCVRLRVSRLCMHARATLVG